MSSDWRPIGTPVIGYWLLVIGEYTDFLSVLFCAISDIFILRLSYFAQ
jgi:hypothetical protein